jgi:predicted kinase
VSALTILALAGLPGTGKSTIARELAALLDAPLFDKDRVREALFGPRHVEHSREQDDFCASLLHRAVEHVAARGVASHVVLDGRTYSRRYQVEELHALAQRVDAALLIVECTASHEAVRERLAGDASHPARDRTFERYLELEHAREPLEPALSLDTSRTSLSECIERVRELLARP